MKTKIPLMRPGAYPTYVKCLIGNIYNCEAESKLQQDQVKAEHPRIDQRNAIKFPDDIQKLIATKINSFGKNPNLTGVEKLSGNKKIDQIPIVAYGNIYEVHNELPRHDSGLDWAPTQN